VDQQFIHQQGNSKGQALGGKGEQQPKAAAQPPKSCLLTEGGAHKTDAWQKWRRSYNQTGFWARGDSLIPEKSIVFIQNKSL
jgi:hypothetical protein